MPAKFLVQSVTNVQVHSLPLGAFALTVQMILNGVMRRNRTAAVGDGELQASKEDGTSDLSLHACAA
jgi:hypothetical protein